MKRSRRRSRKNKSKGKCRQYLSKKISINMEEYRKGMYVSPAQAIAVAYSQVRKSHPACKRVLKQSKKRKSKSKKRRSDGAKKSRSSRSSRSSSSSNRSKIKKVRRKSIEYIMKTPIESMY